MIEFIRSLIEWIHQVIPKCNHAVIYGWPDFEDSAIALEQELQDTDIEKVYLLTTGIPRPPAWKLGGKTKFIRKDSPLGLFMFLRSKYVFFTHPCFVRHFPDDVVSVNVWHGMPIKRIGRMLENHEVIHSSHLLATSPFWANIMNEAMLADHLLENVGIPRNDRLFSDRQKVLRKIGVTSANRIIVWLPTYRKSVRGELREDGHEFGNAFELPDIDLHRLNDYLKSKNAVMLTKPHPMAENSGPREWSHLKIIHDSWLTGHELTLYEAIGSSDILITDISSVMIDFLLVDKPVIHAFPDIDEYRKSRGFTVDPIEDYFAGEVVTNQDELYAALDVELSGKDPHAPKRRALRDLSHTHQDNKSTQRLLNSAGLLL